MKSRDSEKNEKKRLTITNTKAGKQKEYSPSIIEKRWQKQWSKNKIYKTEDNSQKQKAYVLDMFPYPSGEGLHVGHPKGYIATDVYSRFKRMNGFNVLHPMGWDAFGLPAENYAIKNKVAPQIAVAKNIKRFKKQLDIIGLDYDWSREINTTDPEYYRWTQWIFLQMYKKGLAYESYEPINWCPSCQTGLANEDLEDGKCERCGSVVEKKPIRQWVLKITDYAERLLADLDATDYEMPKIIDKTNSPVQGKEFVKRFVAHAIVFDPKNKKYLIIRNKKHGWDTVIIGGVEKDETAEETARREIREETGYTDLEFKRLLGGQTEAQYFAKHKDENRIAVAQAVYFELESDKRVPIAEGEDENDEVLWVSEKDFVPGKMVNSELPIWLERIKNPNTGWPKPLLNWPESIKESQRNWIGQSEGMLFTAPVKDTNIKIQTFSAHFEAFRADTFVVIAPDHKLLPKLVEGIKNEAEILTFARKLIDKRAKQGFAEEKESEGIFTGRYVVDPVGNGDLPIWVASFALADYGTGIVKCSAHDERDFAFAKKYNIRLKPVLFPKDTALAEKVRNLDMCYTDMKNGVLMEPKEFNGKTAGHEKQNIITYLEKNNLATRKTTYKLRDWVFSRQRYWGEPIPIVHCEKCGVVTVPEKDLPVELPKVKNYAPTGTGESPLADITKWVNTKCPVCKGQAKRETNTMPQWAGSSWYYLRYIDPKNKKALIDPKKEKYWMIGKPVDPVVDFGIAEQSPAKTDNAKIHYGVDVYVGGAEHATRHLIYARFWHKFLFDIGVVSTTEPFDRFKNPGLIIGPDGRKMSKRSGNVINPDDIVAIYGADTLRVYEMFMGPFDQAIKWSTESMIGSRRFLEKVWKLQSKVRKAENQNQKTNLDSLLQKTIKKVGEDIEKFNFNTAISTMMILVNDWEKRKNISKVDFEKFLTILAPFAPHITEELWNMNGYKKTIHKEIWPKYDQTELTEKTSRIVVQVNGKVRAMFEMNSDMQESEIKDGVMALDDVKKWLSGGVIKKVIYIEGKLINIVV